MNPITDYFKPSVSSVDGRSDQLMRFGKWTTNGFWAVLSDFEPSLTRDIRDGRDPGNSSEYVKTMAGYEKDLANAVKNQMQVKNHFEIQGKTPIVMIKNGKIVSWINPFYLSYFAKISLPFDLYQAGADKPVYVVTGEKLIGIIMPVKRN